MTGESADPKFFKHCFSFFVLGSKNQTGTQPLKLLARSIQQTEIKNKQTASASMFWFISTGHIALKTSYNIPIPIPICVDKTFKKMLLKRVHNNSMLPNAQVVGFAASVITRLCCRRESVHTDRTFWSGAFQTFVNAS